MYSKSLVFWPRPCPEILEKYMARGPYLPGLLRSLSNGSIQHKTGISIKLN